MQINKNRYNIKMGKNKNKQRTNIHKLSIKSNNKEQIDKELQELELTNENITSSVSSNDSGTMLSIKEGMLHKSSV